MGIAISNGNKLKEILTKVTFLLFALAATGQAVAADEWHYNDVERIVAFSDIHGAYDAMVATLQSAEVLDDNLNWSGGGTHLVIVGDILDRGPDSRAAMDLLMRLEQEAVPAGGYVHVLIGNHEVMNLVGDVRYVAAQEYAAFADDEMVEDRDYWFSAYRSKRELPGQDIAESRTEFDRRFPAGFFAHRKAFSPEGRYGRWLLTKPMIVVVNGIAFVHGGLSPSVAESGLQGINGDLVDDISLYTRQLHVLIDEQVLLPTDSNRKHVEWLARFEPMLADRPAVIEAIADIRRLNDPLFSYQSPHWYRGHTYCSEIIEGDRVQAALKKIGAARVVVGHTPTPTFEVTQRLYGRVIEVDTGMLNSYYKGSGNALVVEDGQLSVINQSGSAPVAPSISARHVGSRPGKAMSAEEIEQMLLHGEIVSASDTDETHLQVTEGGQSIDAIFIEQSRKGIYPEVAAYRLDRLLKLDMVPVTVAREHNGEQGSLQFMPARAIDERQRQLEKSGGGAWCPLTEQWTTMMIFDALAGNDSRSADSILYNLSTWQLMLIGHERAFNLSTAKSTRFKNGRVRIGRSWLAALKSLDSDLLQETLGDVLDKRRIRALGKRRDLLLSQYTGY
jgi:hypothetical protein